MSSSSKADKSSCGDQLDTSILERLIAILQTSTNDNSGIGYSEQLSKALGFNISPEESVRSTIRRLEGAQATLDELSKFMSKFIAKKIQSLESLSSRHIGIEDVPEEILLLIMELSVEYWPDPMEHWDGAVPLSCVCRRFRRVAVGSPRLWVHLSSLTDITETRMYLERSKQLPLEIYLCYPCLRSWNPIQTVAFVAAVLEHSHRWKSFEIDITDDYAQQPDRLRQSLTSISSLCGRRTFPVLKLLELRSSHPWSQDDIAVWDGLEGDYKNIAHFYKEWDCPKLEVVSLENIFPQEATIFTRWHPLSALEIVYRSSRPAGPEGLDINCVQDILRLQPNLERLDIRLFDLDFIHDELKPSVELGKLSTLDLHFRADEEGLGALKLVMKSLSAPNVSRLNLMMYTGFQNLTFITSWIEIAFPDLEIWANVETVNIEIIYDVGTDCEFERVLVLPKLSHLSIAFKSYPRSRARLWALNDLRGVSSSLRTVRLSGVEGICHSQLSELLGKLNNLEEFQKLEVIKCPSFTMSDAEKYLSRSQIHWVD